MKPTSPPGEPRSRVLGSRAGRAVAVSVCLVAVLGALDHGTGYEVSFAFAYLVPVTLTAWYAGRAPAILVAFLSAATWHLANALAGETHSSAFIPFWNASTRLLFFLVVALLVSRQRRLLELERTLSRTDPLTGVANVRAFRDVCEAELARMTRFGRPLTVVLLDLDDFKGVNDRHGHSAGDTLLRRVASSIGQRIRGCDTLGRLGGDEFAILLPETDSAAARSLLMRLRAGIAASPQADLGRVRMSLGAATFLAPPNSVDDLLQRADELMYEAKRGGKDRVVLCVFGLEPEVLLRPDAARQRGEIPSRPRGAGPENMRVG